MATISCCLCRSDISTGEAKKRRKKLHGTSRVCEEARSILISEVDRKFGVGHGLEEIAETCSDNSFLCRKCETNLRKVSELQHLTKQLKSELELHISHFHLKPCVVSNTASGVKRAGPSLGATTSKRPHLETVECSLQQAAVSATAHQSPGVTVCYQ